MEHSQCTMPGINRSSYDNNNSSSYRVSSRSGSSNLWNNSNIGRKCSRSRNRNMDFNQWKWDNNNTKFTDKWINRVGSRSKRISMEYN